MNLWSSLTSNDYGAMIWLIVGSNNVVMLRDAQGRPSRDSPESQLSSPPPQPPGRTPWATDGAGAR